MPSYLYKCKKNIYLIIIKIFWSYNLWCSNLKYSPFLCQYYFLLFFWVLLSRFLTNLKKLKKYIIAKAKTVNICHVHGVINFVLTPLWLNKILFSSKNIAKQLWVVMYWLSLNEPLKYLLKKIQNKIKYEFGLCCT